MQMGAIHDEYGLQTALEQTIKAGADIVIFGNNLVYDQDIALKARDIILDLIQGGHISRERIDESYERIQQLKSWLQ
jgi:beta-N-acetylhexosaminidase